MQDDTSLFDSTAATHEPLAARMRPRNLDEYIGQAHIVGRGRLLRRAIAADQLSSVIFYGPPGSGKTTLARVIAGHTKSSFISLNAVLTGVADIRKAIADAEQQRKLYNKKTILFVDEVHRWNRSQQDALLPWVENGTIILIGATTENPFFEVNKALVSRSRVFQLKALTDDDLLAVARQALADTERGYGHWKVSFEDGALEHLVQTASGDARSLLNALELAVETTPDSWNPQATPPQPSWGSSIYISRETAEESIQKKVVLYDKDGDYHYDIISAFIKSLRGRDPDAACYWLARMVRAGEDPDFIFRRMLISACEDTGLADPQAVTVVSSCAAAFDRVGMPEGRYFLAHAALYLATVPKSNSSMAFFDALAAVEKEDADVPNHLRDANRDAEGFGHGAGYLYPHAYRDHWVAQQYLPDSLVGRVFYTPTTQGYEAHIREDVLSRRELQISSLLEKKTGLESGENVWWGESGNPHPFVAGEENLTFSPEDRKKESALERADRAWRNRLETNRAETL
ncbi:MAG: AAA family ATPase, partial [Treponema sp.]|nr:AAA family ATPase [Treponema sp.]